MEVVNLWAPDGVKKEKTFRKKVTRKGEIWVILRGVNTNIFFCILPRIGEFLEEISKSVKLAFVSVLEI